MSEQPKDDAFKDVENWNEEELSLARSIHLDREFALALAQELNGNTQQDWQAGAANPNALDAQAFVDDDSDDGEDDIAPAPRQAAPAYNAPAANYYNPVDYNPPAFRAAYNPPAAAPAPAPVAAPVPAQIRNYNPAPAAPAAPPSVRSTQNIVVPEEDEDFGWSFSF